MGAKLTATITVPDTSYGSTTTATVTDPHPDSYVFCRCFTGEPVYAAYVPVVDGKATLGPLTSSLWPGGEAGGTAEHGYFRRDGFGRWVMLASTTFAVTA